MTRLLSTLLLPLTYLLLSSAPVYSQSRPSNVSICDYYTSALFGNTNSSNEYTLLTVLVNTAVIGNYSESKTGQSVPGILAQGTVNGNTVNLLPYFTGANATTNVGASGSYNVSGSNSKAGKVNFLDGGGRLYIITHQLYNIYHH